MTASAVEAAIGMVLLAFPLQVFRRCCCSCYRNHVKRYHSFSSSSACNMDASTIAVVESILNYTFKNKNLLVEALTHSSFSKNTSYERLEFVGDAALGLAVATHFFRLEQQKLNPGQLTDLRKDSVSNPKLARMAAKHGLYRFVRRKNTASLDHDVKKYEEEVKQGDDHPDILADIVESLAGAVYLDVSFDLTGLWKIFGHILEVDEIMLPKDGGDGSSEITGAQDELYGLCGKVDTVTTSFPSKMEASMDPPISYNHVTPTSSPFKSEVSITAVDRILNYSFRNKRLLEEALTHSSYSDSTSYQRLEFVGDAALGLALTNHVFLAYPKLDPGRLSLIRAANLSTEKLARVAIKHSLFQFVRHNDNILEYKVREFAKVVSQEDDPVSYGGSMKAPKILADIVESIAAAVYVDIDFNLTKLWVIFRGLLEPIVTLEHLQQQPQPVTLLFEFCQKQGKHVDIKHWKTELKNIASVYVDGEFVASGSSEQKEIAKLNAARGALHKLSESMPVDVNAFGINGIDGSFEIEGAKQKLHELCGKKKLPTPIYELEKDEGRPHEKKFVSSVKIPTVDGTLYITGDEKSRVKEAENSAASFMIRALQESSYL
ncbi:hypothetical protein CRYUN_Cryun39dG0017700 [Craigia yunnanensis]